MTDFPTDLTTAVDNTTDALAKHLNNLEVKVGVDDSAVATSLDYRSKVLMPLQFLTRQAIINGNFDIWQRGTSFTAATALANSNDTYLVDRWNLISDGSDIVDVTRSTDIPDGSMYSVKFQVETANKKFGIVQLIENRDAIKLDNKTVSVSFQAKTTADKLIENLRVAVLSWDSTADTVTSDVVSDWAVEGTNPTWATNWTAENTASNLAITTSWAEYKVEGIDIDTASMANIAVVIWVDDTDGAVDDELFLSQIQLCEGGIALPFQPKSFAQELADCQRYYEVSSIYGAYIGNDNVPVDETGCVSPPATGTAGVSLNWMPFRVAKRTVLPTMLVYSPLTTSTVNKIRRSDTGSIVSAVVATNFVSDKGFSLITATVIVDKQYQYGWEASDEL